jgi:hypothetical protein
MIANHSFQVLDEEEEVKQEFVDDSDYPYNDVTEDEVEFLLEKELDESDYDIVKKEEEAADAGEA